MSGIFIQKQSPSGSFQKDPASLDLQKGVFVPTPGVPPDQGIAQWALTHTVNGERFESDDNYEVGTRGKASATVRSRKGPAKVRIG